jgi:4-amino-4-deoxy-L-arabinose transferase-like glycosyltransferase
MRTAFCAVAFLAFAILATRAARVGLAGDYVDPVGKISAQDEALYANSSIHMAREGGWLTPMFMGRYALYKPPLLIWMSAASARVAGVSRFALRFPVVLLAALAAGLVFLWAAEVRSWQAGVCAAVLLISNHLWHVLGSMAMTDGMLAAFSIAALYCLFSDPWLESQQYRWGYCAASAAAILTKGIAGTLPILVLLLHAAAAPRKYRPRPQSVALAIAMAVLLASPWFIYQMAAHGRWFWTEHVGVEILGYGTGAPPQTSHESASAFYWLRLAVLDPVLLAITAGALPWFVIALRRRTLEATLLACWTVAVLACVLIWQYRNAAYLLPLAPAMALIAACYTPLLSGRAAPVLLALVGAAFLSKLEMPRNAWGLSFERSTIQTLAPVISGYCEQGRDYELILVGLQDDLYASTLPLARLRYALISAAAVPTGYGMDFRSMGITLTAEEFQNLPRLEPVFRDRLRAWGLDSSAPIGSLILVRSAQQLGEIARTHPLSDFLLGSYLRDSMGAQPEHAWTDAGAGYSFLLARHSSVHAAPAGCRL